MKGLSFFEKIVFLLNVIVAFLLLLAYILPFVPPQSFSILSVLSLSVPLLMFLNLVFFLYWLLKLKRQVILSALVILVGLNYISSIYKFSGTKTSSNKSDLSVMTYNVRLFNFFNWLPSKRVPNDIQHFIEKEAPTILCLQEYHKNPDFKLDGYYKFENLSDGKVKSGQAIFSKLPIINSGLISFKKSNNSALFVDVLNEKDTIRVYNVHLQSSKLNTDITAFKNETSQNITRLRDVFKMQQSQAEKILEHKKACNYKTIIAGDFNNTAFSYVYNILQKGNKDAFEVAGKGFGKTFEVNYLPLRIDFILVDDAFEVKGFKNFDIELSDHFPIKATIE